MSKIYYVWHCLVAWGHYFAFLEHTMLSKSVWFPFAVMQGSHFYSGSILEQALLFPTHENFATWMFQRVDLAEGHVTWVRAYFWKQLSLGSNSTCDRSAKSEFPNRTRALSLSVEWRRQNKHTSAALTVVFNYFYGQALISIRGISNGFAWRDANHATAVNKNSD
jgi:hypothetical protein